MAHVDRSDNRPRIAVRFRGADDDVRLPVVRLEQRANGRWYAVVALPRWAEDGTEFIPWDEEVTFPPGHFRQIAGEDYSGLKRVRYRTMYA